MAPTQNAPKKGTEKTPAVAQGGEDAKDEDDDFFRNTRFIGDDEDKTTAEPQRQPPAIVQHPSDTTLTQYSEEAKAEVPNEQMDDVVPPKQQPNGPIGPIFEVIPIAT